jgi:predicted phage terminase large subunit-like protein
MPEISTFNPVNEQVKELLQNPLLITRELNNRSLYHFIQYFWPVYSAQPFSPNWHIKVICDELEQVAKRVAERKPRDHDLIINIPPGSTKTATASIMFPIWCWTQWPWMLIITMSYSDKLSLESAEYCRDILRSQRFQEMYPDIAIKEDKDVKSNFKIAKKSVGAGGIHRSAKMESTGGGRISTSITGTIMGFHADILIVDDPLNPTQAASDIELANANHFMEQTLPSRKRDKDITPTILIMQRLNQHDPSGAWLDKNEDNVRHICLPGEIQNFREFVKPPELAQFYVDNLLDTKRISWKVLKDMESKLGQYGYAGQIGQHPTPPGGGMFKVDEIAQTSEYPLPNQIEHTIRAWDKAGTANGGDYTVGVKMSRLVNNKWLIEDVIRGQWSTNDRERIIRSTAERDGHNVEIWMEQEGGSGGKESAEATIRNLAGFRAYAERPTGDKTHRADPLSVQVNNKGVMMTKADWNHALIDEMRYFPMGNHDDQIDALSLAFTKLVARRIARRVT